MEIRLQKNLQRVLFIDHCGCNRDSGYQIWWNHRDHSATSNFSKYGQYGNYMKLPSTNEESTNEIYEKFNLLDQLKEIIPELFDCKRTLEIMENPSSPSKDPMKAKQRYTLLNNELVIRIVKRPRIFQKLPDEPGISPTLVDLVSSFMVDAHMAANKLRNEIKETRLVCARGQPKVERRLFENY
jgi:hypothetical protein